MKGKLKLTFSQCNVVIHILILKLFYIRNFLKAQVIDLENKIRDLDNKCFDFEVQRAELEKNAKEKDEIHVDVIAEAKAPKITCDQSMNTDIIEEVVVKPVAEEPVKAQEVKAEELVVVPPPVQPIIQQVHKVIKINLPLPYADYLSKSKQNVVLYKKGGYAWMLILVSSIDSNCTTSLLD